MPRRLLLAALCLAAAPAWAANVLLVTGSGSLTSGETARKAQFESWGHTVTTIVDSASQGSFDAAMAGVDVVYIPATVQEWEISTKAKTTTKGVVCEEPYLDVMMGFSTNLGWYASHSQTEILNNTHSITTGLSTGYVTIANSSTNMAMMNNTLAAGMTVLSKQNYSAGNMMGVIEANGSLAGGGTAAGRRVRTPWGGDGFNWSALNANGLKIAQQAIAWAVGGDNEGLLLHWKLNETGGSTAVDASGKGHDGTLTGTTGWTDGVRGGGVDLASGAKVQVSGLLGEPTNFTIAAWAKLDTPSSNGAEVISLGDHIGLRIQNGGICWAFFDSGSTWENIGYTFTSTGKGWVHYLATFDDATDSLKLYINGKLVASKTTTASVDYNGLGSNTLVGKHGNGDSNYNFDGAIDDVRVYGSALSEAEIAEVYGLIGHWKFDETSGTVAYDSSGAGNHASHNGTPTWAAGRVDGAIELDGSSEHLSVSTIAPLLNGSDGFGAAVWVRSDVTNTDRGVFYGDTPSHSDRNVGLRYDRDGISGGASQCVKMSVMSTTANPQLESGSNVQTLEWQHLAMSWASGDAIRFWVNGVEQSPAYVTSSNGGVLKDVATLIIGQGGSTDHWDGLIDDLRLYNRAITDEEIADLTEPGLIAHWRLDETSGTTAVDGSSAGNNGTYTGGVALNGMGPYPGVGAVAASFDGSNGYVDIPNEGLYDITGPMTVAAWIKVDAFDHHFQTIVAKGDSAWRLSRDASTNKLHFACNGLSNQYLYGDIEVNDGAWHHVVGVYTGSAIRLYVDGVLDKSASSTGTISTNDEPVAIGKNSQVSQRNWEGGLFDVRIYGYGLSEEEIAELYGLVGYWKLDESGGTTAADSSGRGRHGSYLGSPTLGESGPKSDTFAAEFEGVDDCVMLPTIDDTFADGAAISVWARPAGANNYEKFLQLAEGTSLPIDLGREGTSDTLRGTAYDGSAATNSGGLHQGVWRHYAMSVDSSGTMRLYRDGALLSETAVTPPTAGPRSSNWIGASNWGSDALFEGRLREVRAYNRPISDEEAQALYFGEAAGGPRIVRWVEVANP